jgi:hypothetical protein
VLASKLNNDKITEKAWNCVSHISKESTKKMKPLPPPANRQGVLQPLLGDENCPEVLIPFQLYD